MMAASALFFLGRVTQPFVLLWCVKVAIMSMQGLLSAHEIGPSKMTWHFELIQ